MPDFHTPLRVIPFFSGSASSALAMYNDSNRGTLYDVVGAFTDRPEAEKSVKGRELFEQGYKVPLLGLCRKDFYEREGLYPQDPGSRRRYYQEVARMIEGFEADVIAICGYMHIITDPLLTRYVVLNVHPADLSVLTGPMDERIHLGCMEREEAERIIGKRDLRRKYTGDDAVFDAVTAGEDYTLSTVHVAIEEPDMGPIIVQSQAFQVDQNRVRGMSSKELRQYVDDLQGEMKTLCDGPAYLKALELLAAGLSVTADRRLILNGEELLYGGVQL